MPMESSDASARGWCTSGEGGRSVVPVTDLAVPVVVSDMPVVVSDMPVDGLELPVDGLQVPVADSTVLVPTRAVATPSLRRSNRCARRLPMRALGSAPTSAVVLPPGSTNSLRHCSSLASFGRGSPAAAAAHSRVRQFDPTSVEGGHGSTGWNSARTAFWVPLHVRVWHVPRQAVAPVTPVPTSPQ